MCSPRVFRLWVTVCLVVLTPQLALAQQARKAGVVTGLKGQAAVARATLSRPASLNFKDDVFFQDTLRTERDSIVRVLLGGKALVTVRELSDFSIQEQPNRATINLGFGRMALEVIKRLMSPGEEIEVRTPNAVAAIRGSFVLWDVTPDQTTAICLTESSHTSGGATYTCGVNEQWTFRQGQPPTHQTLTAEQIQGYVLQYVGGLPKLDGDKPPVNLASLISANQMQTTVDTFQSGTPGGPGVGGPPTPPPPPQTPPNNGNLCVQCSTITHNAAGGLAGGNGGSGGGLLSLNTVPMPTFSEGLFSFNGAPFNQATITFPSAGAAPRFALDNLTITGTFGTLQTTYSENPPGTVPVNGLSFRGVQYAFTVDGIPSTDATFGGSGPGSITNVQDPSLEGNASGQLTLTFTQPVSSLSFGLARSTFSPLTPGALIDIGTWEEYFTNLQGAATAPDPDPNPVTLSPSGLILGTDRPRPDGAGLLDTSVSSQKGLRIDTALLEASAPLLNMVGGSATVPNDLVLLGKNAKLATTAGFLPSDALLTLTGGTLNITNGHVVNVAGGSRLAVGGDLVRVSNGGTLNILNGVLLAVSDGSIASISGALVRFGGTGGNTINVANTFAPTSFFSGVPVYVAPGAAANLSIAGTPLAGLNALGSIRINGTPCTPSCAGANGSLVAVTGTGGTIKIGP